jgi:hypothetical protein
MPGPRAYRRKFRKKNSSSRSPYRGCLPAKNAGPGSLIQESGGRDVGISVAAAKRITRIVRTELVMQTLGLVCQSGEIIIVECVRRTGEHLVLWRRCALESDIILHEPLVKYSAVIGLYGGASHIRRGRQGVIMIPGIQMDAETDLPHIVGAFCALRRRACAGQSREQQRGENGEDGNNDQELNQGEAGAHLAVWCHNSLDSSPGYASRWRRTSTASARTRAH